MYKSSCMQIFLHKLTSVPGVTSPTASQETGQLTATLTSAHVEGAGVDPRSRTSSSTSLPDQMLQRQHSQQLFLTVPYPASAEAAYYPAREASATSVPSADDVRSRRQNLSLGRQGGTWPSKTDIGGHASAGGRQGETWFTDADRQNIQGTSSSAARSRRQNSSSAERRRHRRGDTHHLSGSSASLRRRSSRDHGRRYSRDHRSSSSERQYRRGDRESSNERYSRYRHRSPSPARYRSPVRSAEHSQGNASAGRIADHNAQDFVQMYSDISDAEYLVPGQVPHEDNLNTPHVDTVDDGGTETAAYVMHSPTKIKMYRIRLVNSYMKSVGAVLERPEDWEVWDRTSKDLWPDELISRRMDCEAPASARSTAELQVPLYETSLPASLQIPVNVSHGSALSEPMDLTTTARPAGTVLRRATDRFGARLLQRAQQPPPAHLTPALSSPVQPLPVQPGVPVPDPEVVDPTDSECKKREVCLRWLRVLQDRFSDTSRTG